MFFSVKVEEAPKQDENSGDCGIFLLANARSLLLVKTFLPIIFTSTSICLELLQLNATIIIPHYRL